MASKSIMQTEKECFITGYLNHLDRHHVFWRPAEERIRTIRMLDLAPA